MYTTYFWPARDIPVRGVGYEPSASQESQTISLSIRSLSSPAQGFSYTRRFFLGESLKNCHTFCRWLDIKQVNQCNSLHESLMLLGVSMSPHYYVHVQVQTSPNDIIYN